MGIGSDENPCYRCHVRTKFLETFKSCQICSKRFCSQCWIEFYRLDHRTRRKCCFPCLDTLIKKKSEMKTPLDDEQFQLALALSLSEKEAEEQKTNVAPALEIEMIDQDEILLQRIHEIIERFFNRAKSNYQRHRDITADTALLSAFISLQTCANDLDQLRDRLYRQRQYFENLQEKLTSLRDAREALNLLRYERQQKKQHEREQHRWIMMQKVADLRDHRMKNMERNHLGFVSLIEHHTLHSQQQQQVTSLPSSSPTQNSMR